MSPARVALLLPLALLVAATAPTSTSTGRRLQQAQSSEELRAAVTPETGPEVDAFPILYGGYRNYFLSDDITSGVVLVQEEGRRLPDGAGARLLVAFPAANSGGVAYFNASKGPSEQLVMRLENGTLRSTVYNGSAGLTGILTFDRDATLYRAIVGSIRTVRDYVEGPRIVRPLFAHTARMEGLAVVLHREYLNGTGANTLVFAPADNSTTLRLLPDGNFAISLAPGSTQARLNLTATVTAPRVEPITPPRVLVSSGAQELAILPQLNQFAFLTYRDKFLAGSWRFLTYFGRDSLITLRLMMSGLSATSIEAALGAALANLNERQNYTQQRGAIGIPVGTVCHEETLGDYASFVNIENGNPELGGALWCDYKMVDSDFLLAPAAAIYLLELNQSEGREQDFLGAFVDTPVGRRTNLELLEDNAALVLNLSRPFAADPSVANLVHLRPEQPVGNWRDSNNGLGGGRVPMDVQFLVPGALRAIENLAAAGILDPAWESRARMQADIWEARAPPFFRVSLPLDRANAALADYASSLRLPTPPPLAASPTGNLTFYALSLHDDGSPVPIMHSDLSLSMSYAGGPLPPEVLSTVPALLADFPAGLLVPGVGMAVANPAYASGLANASVASALRQNFTAGDYHGTVIWGWQNAMMVEGLQRHLAFCDSPQAEPAPAFCTDTALVSALRSRLERLWSTVLAAKDVAFSEVWSWKPGPASTFQVASLAENAGQSLAGTESNAVQLWSYSFLVVPSPFGNGTLLQPS